MGSERITIPAGWVGRDVYLFQAAIFWQQKETAGPFQLAAIKNKVTSQTHKSFVCFFLFYEMQSVSLKDDPPVSTNVFSLNIFISNLEKSAHEAATQSKQLFDPL